MVKSNHYLYKTYSGMKQRCLNHKHTHYKNYGGRGIKVCERWLNSFESFLEDMGDRPTSNHSLDRIDNDGDYSPENCRWATYQEQARNSRKNRILDTPKGKMCITEAAETFNFSLTGLYKRINRGWPVEKALTTPKRNRTKKKPWDWDLYTKLAKEMAAKHGF